jgi:hypothetical protein
MDEAKEARRQGYASLSSHSGGRRNPRAMQGRTEVAPPCRACWEQMGARLYGAAPNPTSNGVAPALRGHDPISRTGPPQRRDWASCWKRKGLPHPSSLAFSNYPFGRHNTVELACSLTSNLNQSEQKIGYQHAQSNPHPVLLTTDQLPIGDQPNLHLRLPTPLGNVDLLCGQAPLE